MTNKTPNTTHLKQGQTIPDSVHKAKLDGTHWTDAANKVAVTPTPDSNTSAGDSRLGSKNTPDGARGWAPINPAAADNTYTGKGGSKR